MPDDEQNLDPTTPDPSTDPAALEAEQENEGELPPWAQEKLRKANREAQNLRTRLREVEPLAQEAEQRREAEKTEIQRATDRAEQLERDLAQSRLEVEIKDLVVEFKLDPEDQILISGAPTPEARRAAAERVAAKNAAAATPQITPPPTNRPNAALRPGATPAVQDNTPPTAYPPEWIPNRNRARDKRE
ncbi:hypothetical protein ACFXG4_27180 [Nocardia sp. NPDC059246]|uniref:hypothetical protein n=1 Tax=unclassified Nocardia TaxID=2637762 RepID=UPI0036ACD67B